jgi:hypothetical protein
MILTGSKFADAVGVSRQRISKCVGLLQLEKNENGKIDTDSELNQTYIYGDPAKIEAFEAFVKLNSSGVSKPSKKGSKTPKVKKTTPKSNNKQQEKPVVGGDTGDLSKQVNNYSSADITKMKQEAEMLSSREKYLKLQLANQKERNELATRETLTFLIERFVNHFVTGIPRVSSTSLQDVSKLILESGKVENSHFSMFEDACMELVDGAKDKVLRDLKNIEK